MSHIALPQGLPGILGPMAFRPDTAQALNLLADTLLHRPNSLPAGERELIATYVSYLNSCHFCHSSHGAAAAAHLGEEAVVDQVRQDFTQAPVSDKLKALLAIAGQVQKGGKHVTPAAVETARSLGATDMEIHDTVLIAAAFCMFNRYVDGLATWAPQEAAAYRPMGEMLARDGYVQATASHTSNAA